jgi:hypothetical protein
MAKHYYIILFLAGIFIIWIFYSLISCVKRKQKENNLFQEIFKDIKILKKEIQHLKNKD